MLTHELFSAGYSLRESTGTSLTQSGAAMLALNIIASELEHIDLEIEPERLVAQ